MLDIHDEFARFMARIGQLTRRERHEAILSEIREQANGARIERTADDVVITLHGLTGRDHSEPAAIGEWYRRAKERQKNRRKAE